MDEIKHYISAEGLQKLKDELEHLKKVVRHEIIQKIVEAKAFGDLSENAAYAEAREQQAFVEIRIFELEDLIKKAVIIHKKSGDMVTVGASIKIEGNGKIKEYKIVGQNEAAPANGLISNESPLGRAFLGHKTGDEVAVETPAGKIVYKILTVF
ncbi:MAG: transcription elongation factor GreA [Patescibacteria group bacterium]